MGHIIEGTCKEGDENSQEVYLTVRSDDYNWFLKVHEQGPDKAPTWVRVDSIVAVRPSTGPSGGNTLLHITGGHPLHVWEAAEGILAKMEVYVP